MDLNFVYTGLVLGASGGLIYSLKSIPEKLYKRVKRNLVYNVKVYQYDDLFNILEGYLYSHYSQRYNDVEASYDQGTNPTEPGRVNDKVLDQIMYKQEETTFMIKYKGKNLIVTKDKEKIDKVQSLKDIYFRKYSLSGYRAKKEIDAFLQEAINYSKNKKEENIVKVFTNTSYGDWYSGQDVKVKPLIKTILNPEIKLPLIADIDEFLKSEQWYLDTNIAYKRGLGLYGPPGTGKTTLALAIANYTKRRVYCLNLNCLENDSRLPRSFSDMADNSILLIEDIDKIFSGRENVNPDCKVTFSALLNCLDGAFYKHGLITIITTNHIDKLDEALLRTGRIDLKLEIPLPTEKEISEYLAVFYNIPTFTIEGDFKLKMSDVQEICLKNKNNINNAIKELEKWKNYTVGYSPTMHLQEDGWQLRERIITSCSPTSLVQKS